MINHIKSIFITSLVLGLMTTSAIANDGYECYQGKKVCREKATGMPLKALPRAFPTVYDKPNGTKQMSMKPIKAFRPLYVFARQDIDTSDPDNPKGWYKIGKSKKRALGWMQAKDVIEWKQALIMAYTHPGEDDERRNPVLMFNKLPALKGIIQSPEREAEISKAYTSLDKDPKERYPSLVLTESKRFVDINENFYFLPIVNFEMLDLEGEDARYLQIAAAITEATAAKLDTDLRDDNNTLDNPEVQKEVLKNTTSSEAVKQLEVDIVFVMDLTSSMEPYLRMTLESVQDIARLVTKDIKKKVHFGFVGYRDNPAIVNNIEFASKDFTKDGLVSAEQFVDMVSKVKVASVGSVDYQEELFAGVETGLETKWSDNSIRLMILVGDASSHEPGHPQNVTGKDENVLRQAADDSQVHILAIHLQNQDTHPEIVGDLPKARQQFATLARVSGSEKSALLEVNADKEEDFAKAVKATANMITEFVGTALTGNMTTPTVSTTKNDNVVDKAEEVTKMLLESALVEYKGKEAVPPKDIIAWAVDRDLADPAIPALEVRILLNKTQLDSLVRVVNEINMAMKNAETTEREFFEALQSVAATSIKDPSKIGTAKNLKDAGLLPDFLDSLPYKSEIASLSDERFASWTTQKRTDFSQRLEAKLAQYRSINEAVDKWIVLDESDPDNTVYPLHIDYLP
ncbi:vWA domain-containing protein [Candidatus Halobeggiatoa sp. HSG11]|nr:vWA domain-containing protein [Candidatus Halobeggiatoa sp. HSG11]